MKANDGGRLVKEVTAAELGGAAFDSHGNMQGPANQVWTVVAVPADGGSIYLSLHTTEGGARTRLSEKAHE